MSGTDEPEGGATYEANENSSREKTTQWLEDVLQTHLTYKERKKKSEAGENVDSSPPLRVTVMDFDIGAGYSGEGRLTTLSDLLSLKVWFRVEGCDEEKTDNLIVKIPPNDSADREMAHLAQVDKREIHFYTEALIQMEAWALSRKAEIELSVPECYFAKYHTQPNLEDGPSLSDAESVLVLEDIRPIGFSMRDFGAGLTVNETMAALREIAKIHALSWAMQETIGQPLDEKWHFAYKPHKAASAYKMMIEQGFPTLAEFLEKQTPDGADLLDRLKKLHPRAAELLCELLEPPPAPAPSCLTHMDFWCNNLLFRVPTPPEGSEVGATENAAVECRILDWQMMAVSRPTHDVALLLFTSLTPDTRKQNLNAFLRYYWSTFQATAQKLGVEPAFDFTVIEQEYKKSQLLALLLVIGSIDLALDAEATEERLMQALRDMAEQELI